jgi:hypothetical protein
MKKTRFRNLHPPIRARWEAATKRSRRRPYEPVEVVVRSFIPASVAQRQSVATCHCGTDSSPARSEGMYSMED